MTTPNNSTLDHDPIGPACLAVSDSGATCRIATGHSGPHRGWIPEGDPFAESEVWGFAPRPIADPDPAPADLLATEIVSMMVVLIDLADMTRADLVALVDRAIPRIAARAETETMTTPETTTPEEG